MGFKIYGKVDLSTIFLLACLYFIFSEGMGALAKMCFYEKGSEHLAKDGVKSFF